LFGDCCVSAALLVRLILGADFAMLFTQCTWSCAVLFRPSPTKTKILFFWTKFSTELNLVPCVFELFLTNHYQNASLIPPDLLYHIVLFKGLIFCKDLIFLFIQQNSSTMSDALNDKDDFYELVAIYYHTQNMALLVQQQELAVAQ
jgi:hypothetical protein